MKGTLLRMIAALMPCAFICACQTLPPADAVITKPYNGLMLKGGGCAVWVDGKSLAIGIGDDKTAELRIDIGPFNVRSYAPAKISSAPFTGPGKYSNAGIIVWKDSQFNMISGRERSS